MTFDRRKTMDRELKTLRSIVAQLEAQDSEAKVRIVRYLHARYCEALEILGELPDLSPDAEA